MARRRRRALTRSPRLDGAELCTTAIAVAVSTSLYLRLGHPYLARGVTGDLVGLAALAVPLATTRRRLRHEACVCLGAIGIVLLARPEWPVRYRPRVLWAAVTVGVAGYVLLRSRRLR